MANLENYFQEIRDFLEEFIDPDSGLIEKLFSKGILNRREMKEIEAKDTYFNRNSLILHKISDKRKIPEFCVALKDSGQQHIVNYLNSRGKHSGDGDWPLTERETSIIDGNYEALVEILDTCDLIGHLYSNRVVNRRQLEFISSRSTSYEKSKALLEMLRRCSLGSYGLTIKCLRDANQNHIAEIFETGGNIVRVHATVESDSLDETETQIVDEMANLLTQRNVSTEKAYRLLSATQLKIIAINRGQSIVLYVCCSKKDEFDRMAKMIDNSRMKNLLQKLFRLLVHNFKLKVISVKILEREKQLFTSQLHELDREEIWRKAIYRHRRFIADRMNRKFYFEDKLVAYNCLTDKMINKIKNTKTARKRNEIIIYSLGKRQQLEKLIEALAQSNQKHLVRYLECDGKYDKNFGGDWPLTNREFLIIRSNYDALADLMKSQDLMDLLYETGVINRKQREFIGSQSKLREKNETFLQILKSSTLNSYWQTIRCLHQKNQSNIAKILETGGILVRVDVKIKEIDLLKTEEMTTKTITRINDICYGMQTIDDEHILDEILQLKLFGAKQSDNVSFYFLCNQSEEVDRLQEMAEDERLNEFAESLFGQLLRTRVTINIQLNMTEDIFTTSRNIIEEICAEYQFMDEIPKSIDRLPLELLDVILLKAGLVPIIKDNIINDARVENFKQLAEVNCCWFERMITRRIKSVRWSYLSDIYEKRTSVSLFLRLIHQFIEENWTHLRTDANRFKRLDLLSDIQCVLIARKSFAVKKMQSPFKPADLSLALNCNNENNLNLFIEYLRISRQYWIARAMRTRGTSARVEISNRGPIKDEKVNRFFQDSGTENLGSMKDRDYVRWIWCKSANPNEKKQSKYQRLSFCNLIEEDPHCLNKIRVNVDSDQLKKEAVVFPHIFDESLEAIDEQDYKQVRTIGVTKLRNEFYCLNRDLEIKVFDDRYPFVLFQKFQLKEVKEPKDIVSNEKENALYILDIHRNPDFCVWKIIRNSKTNENELKWLELPVDFQPRSLSMSRNGQLLMVSREPSPSLRVYGPDAQLRLSISLHQCIKNPIHAVETSNGNFVIMHFLDNKNESMITSLGQDGKTIVHNYQPKNEEQRVISLSAGHLSIDSNDRLLVADYYNNRVILLDSNLRWNQILIPNKERTDEDSGKKMYRYPQRLYYDEEKKQLLVVCGFNGEVTVFPKCLIGNQYIF